MWIFLKVRKDEIQDIGSALRTLSYTTANVNDLPWLNVEISIFRRIGVALGCIRPELNRIFYIICKRSAWIAWVLVVVLPTNRCLDDTLDMIIAPLAISWFSGCKRRCFDRAEIRQMSDTGFLQCLRQWSNNRTAIGVNSSFCCYCRHLFGLSKSNRTHWPEKVIINPTFSGSS